MLTAESAATKGGDEKKHIIILWEATTVLNKLRKDAFILGFPCYVLQAGLQNLKNLWLS